MPVFVYTDVCLYIDVWSIVVISHTPHGVQIRPVKLEIANLFAQFLSGNVVKHTDPGNISGK